MPGPSEMGTALRNGAISETPACLRGSRRLRGPSSGARYPEASVTRAGKAWPRAAKPVACRYVGIELRVKLTSAAGRGSLRLSAGRFVGTGSPSSVPAHLRRYRLTFVGTGSPGSSVRAPQLLEGCLTISVRNASFSWLSDPGEG